jgi:hypothetical protein
MLPVQYSGKGEVVKWTWLNKCVGQTMPELRMSICRCLRCTPDACCLDCSCLEYVPSSDSMLSQSDGHVTCHSAPRQYRLAILNSDVEGTTKYIIPWLYPPRCNEISFCNNNYNSIPGKNLTNWLNALTNWLNTLTNWLGISDTVYYSNLVSEEGHVLFVACSGLEPT